MQDNEFSTVAQQLLSLIADTIETQDKDGLIDVDLHNDILNLTTDKGIFVINKHSAAKEIWLASPISGPYHFAYMAGTWRSKLNIDLFEILEHELRISFNQNSI